MLVNSKLLKPVNENTLKDFYLVKGIKVSSYKLLGTYGNRFLVVEGRKKTYILDLIDIYLHLACFSFSKLGDNYYVYCPKKFLEEVTLF